MDDEQLAMKLRAAAAKRISHNFVSNPVPNASVTNTTGEDKEDMDNRGREMAMRCWNEDEDFLPKEKIAEWLGGQ